MWLEREKVSQNPLKLYIYWLLMGNRNPLVEACKTRVEGYDVPRLQAITGSV